MLKLTNVGKLVAISAVLTASVLVPGRIVNADTINPNFVPNTTVCGQSNVNQTKNGGEFTITRVNGYTYTITVTKAPRADITLFASSYHLTNPDYRGGCFSATGSTPQTYDGNTQTIKIPCGFTGTKTVTVQLPTTCYNEQVDLYYGKNGKPLNGDVTASGHEGYNYIMGNIILTSDNAACVTSPGTISDTPATTDTPSTPVTTPQVESASTVQPILTDTGANVAFTSTFAAALLAAASYVFVRRNKVSE